MVYDFTRLRKAIVLSGKTLQEVEGMTGVSHKTISRAIRTGRAFPSTALRLVNAFQLKMEDIYMEPRKRRA